jgi:hypothetical protein
MRLRLVCVALSLVATGSGPVFGQGATSSAPEHRIAFFAGNWTFTGEMNGVRFGPDRPGSSVSEQCEMLGPVFLVCDYQIVRSDAVLKGLGVFGYDRIASASSQVMRRTVQQLARALS